MEQGVSRPAAGVLLASRRRPRLVAESLAGTQARACTPIPVPTLHSEELARRMADDLVMAEALQLEEVLRLSGNSGSTSCAVCRLMIVSLEASWKPGNCNHVICIACFCKYRTETVANKLPKCPVAYCNSLFKPEIHDGGGLISIKEIDKGKGKKPCNEVLQEFGQCFRGVIIHNEFHCTICMETVPAIERFPIAGCTHAFCLSCMRQYIAAKVEENVLLIGCPDPVCKGGTLHPEVCRDVIPPQLFQRWGAALCDIALGTLKFYCPFKDCSALLVHDSGDGVITNVECPHCNRMFCAQCKVPWHDGVACSEFQLLGKDEREREDLQLRKVALESKWQRCPKCNIYVERVDGCVYIKCRCGNCFCYLCGSTMERGNHRCKSCKRTW